MTIKLIVLAALLAGACSTVTPLKAIKNPDLNLQEGPGDNQNFEKLLSDFSQDSTTLLGRAGEMNAAEAAFSVGLLAAASYGAYSTTYSGNNLKDAAFAAATLTGLRSLITPGQRRDAARVAGIRLNCLARAAAPFKGDYSLGSAAAAGAFGGVVNLNASGYSAFTSVPTLKAALLAGAETSSPIAGFAAGAPAAVENARREGLAQSIAENVVQLLVSEQDLHKNRHQIVAAAYRTIIAALRRDTPFRAVAYDAELAAYKAAVENATKAKVAAEQTARDSAALTRKSGPGLNAFVEAIKRYAEAQAAVGACAALL